MQMRWSLPLAVTLLMSQAACYTTKIVTNRQPESRAYSHTDRQWFTIGGLVPLSGPAGRECEHGLSYAESQMSGVDILINIGMTVGGALVGAAACGGDETRSASCATSFATLAPFLLGTRTVEYTCAAAPTAPSWAPTAPGVVPPPPSTPAPSAAPSTPPPPPPTP
jgi:hypothetical protein